MRDYGGYRQCLLLEAEYLRLSFGRILVLNLSHSTNQAIKLLRGPLMAPSHIFNYGHPYPVINATLSFVVLANAGAQDFMHDLDCEEYLLWKPNRNR